jgi:hypothetical protein
VAIASADANGCLQDRARRGGVNAPEQKQAGRRFSMSPSTNLEPAMDSSMSPALNLDLARIEISASVASSTSHAWTSSHQSKNLVTRARIWQAGDFVDVACIALGTGDGFLDAACIEVIIGDRFLDVACIEIGNSNGFFDVACIERHVAEAKISTPAFFDVSCIEDTLSRTIVNDPRNHFGARGSNRNHEH